MGTRKQIVLSISQMESIIEIMMKNKQSENAMSDDVRFDIEFHSDEKAYIIVPNSGYQYSGYAECNGMSVDILGHKPNLTKSSESSLLRKLSSMNGYFAEYFASDIDQMIENIKNDYPIEMDTAFGKKDSTHKKEMQKICEIMLESAHQSGDIELMKTVIGLQGHKWVIRYKLKHNLTLSEFDNDFIINNL